MMYSDRYDDYYLVTNEPSEEVGFDEKPKKCCTRRSKIIGATMCLSSGVLLFLLVFVAFPLVFMFSIDLQRMLLFNHFGQPSDRRFYDTFYFPSYKNQYLNYTNTEDNITLSLGTWHLLPVPLAIEALHDKKYDFQKALSNSNYSVLIYFHGNGETRALSHRKYQLLTQLFHVITFDYRSYADSTKATLSERGILRDCIEVCNWIRNRTNASIYIWGHSLGSALAAESAAYLTRQNFNISGLILEAAFTSLHDELYEHPFGKIFAWLPWFKITILEPLRRNKFIFNSAGHIKHLTCPIMILHAQDDQIVPVKLGRKMYEIASNRTANNSTIYHEFDASHGYDHVSIYQDPFLLYYIMEFMSLS